MSAPSASQPNSGTSSTALLERNLRLIPILSAITRSFIFLPVFVLYLRSRFGLDGALQLAALYYLFVPVLEVPSGWMSDRIGRVPTLTGTAASWIIAHSCFLLGDDNFAFLVVGQLFIAVGYSFLSGTDVSFHYDTLEALGREDEYAARQARVSSLSYLAGGASAVTGGALGLIDLRLAFVAALLIALVQLAVTRMLHEPAAEAHADPFVNQIGKCLAYLRNRFIGWLFFYGIVLVTLEHMAYEMMQPWLTEALGKSPDELGATPLVSGLLVAAVATVGAASARFSATMGRRFGTVASLVGLATISAVVVSAMALSFSVVVLVLVLLRSVQAAAAPVLISAAVAPRTRREHRATLLSLNSLAGRLGFGLLLQFVAIGAGDDPQPVLRVLAVISWSLVALLIGTGWIARNQESRERASAVGDGSLTPT